MSARSKASLSGRQTLGLALLLCLADCALAPRATAGGKAPEVKLRPAVSARAQVAIDLPESWRCNIQELADGLLATDCSGGCTVELFLNPASLTLAETVRLYQALYFGPDAMSDREAEELRRGVRWPEELHVGRFAQRSWGPEVYALFARHEGQVVVLLLRCPVRNQHPPGGALVAAIFASFRRFSMGAPDWPAARGVFSPLYFFLKRPLKRSQTPDSSRGFSDSTAVLSQSS
jgi:hypothetical protein